MGVITSLDSYDWQHVFEYAGRDGYECGECKGRGKIGVDFDTHECDACSGRGLIPDENAAGSAPRRVNGAACAEDVFGRADVEHVFDQSEGERDGAKWLIAGVLKDGRFFFIEAGCDYTGWDCQANGTSWVSDTLGQLARFGLTDEARERLPGVAAALAQGVWT